MKMRLKSLKKVKRRKKIVWFFIFLVIIIVISDIFRKITNLLDNYAKFTTKQIVTIAINRAVDDEAFNKLKEMSMYNISKNSDGEILTIDYDSLLLNTFLNTVTNNLQSDLIAIENGNFSSLPLRYKTNIKNASFTFPLGSIFSFPLFSEFGPKIPVRLDFVSAVMTNIKTTVKEYGINNALIEMSIFLRVEANIVLPYFLSNVTVENEIPVSYQVITGKVPSYYGASGIVKNSDIFSIPLEN